eukprot:6187150-Pleurochrysis_carterae.AAC.3
MALSFAAAPRTRNVACASGYNSARVSSASRRSTRSIVPLPLPAPRACSIYCGILPCGAAAASTPTISPLCNVGWTICARARADVCRFRNLAIKWRAVRAAGAQSRLGSALSMRRLR